MTTPALPSPYSLATLDSVDSTNDEAARRAAAGAPHGTVVWARQQTAGRGRRGRGWHSPPGNLHCSILLRTDRPPVQAAQVGFVAAVALAEALETLAPRAAFGCKWPNDVLCNGRKIAGLLLESAGEGAVVLGVGVDVGVRPHHTSFPATCLRAEGSAAEPAEVLAAFVDRFATWYDTWDGAGLAPVRAAWLHRAHGLGAPVTVRLGEGRELRGIFADLDADGAMLLDQDGGERRRVLAGEVFFPGA